jgi:hypothetical protein
MTRLDGIGLVAWRIVRCRSSSIVGEFGPCILFVKIRSPCYLGRMLGNESAGFARPIAREWSQTRFFALGGHDNPLKRLISAKRIQALFFDCLWPGVGGLGWILNNLGLIWIRP